ncbi:MAG: TIGR00300 family protein [candidate division Zixibacteria bacterium]|nr:TIGR00300 family protein [candidate division Zixibacteria bacterium]
MNMFIIEQTVVTEGHLIDSGLMRKIFDTIIADGGKFEMLDFRIGTNNDEFSHARLKITCETAVHMNTILQKLSSLGCQIETDDEVALQAAPADGVVPPDFYSSTNHITQVRHHGVWIEVDKIRMDGVIVVDGGVASIKKFRSVKKGDKVATGLSGIKVKPEFVERDRSIFTFMSGEVSTERQVRLAVNQVADIIESNKKRIGVVAGPVVVHTGGAGDLSRLIDSGHIDALLSGNALAVHDIEANLYGTSLGIDNKTGKPVEMGHRNHLRAINEVRRAGSIANLVSEGTLTDGVMHSVVKTGIPYSLAGSLRDDGPLPETITDMNEAQEDYARILADLDVVMMLSSMLHSIAAGNMIPARILTICVDINPAVVTKLKDRGSMQTIGIVTDVGLFLHLLANRLDSSH